MEGAKHSVCLYTVIGGTFNKDMFWFCLSEVGLNVYLSLSKNDEALQFVDFTTKFYTVTRNLDYTLAMVTGLSKI